MQSNSKYSDVTVVASHYADPMPNGSFDEMVDYDGATKVYVKNYSDTFHADKRCPRILSEASPDHSDMTDTDRWVSVMILPLVNVLSKFTDPVKACSHCTQPMQECARTAVQTDGLPSFMLKVFERGESRYTTTITRQDGQQEVTTSQKVIE